MVIARVVDKLHSYFATHLAAPINSILVISYRQFLVNFDLVYILAQIWKGLSNADMHTWNIIFIGWCLDPNWGERIGHSTPW
jgi:hypothetical protein